MDRHPDFKFESFRSRISAKTTVAITHDPTGLVSRGESWLGDHAHIDAWKGMANLLAERFRHKPPQPQPASLP